MQPQREDNGGVLIVTGHAIYQGHRWQGGRPGEDRYYEGHVVDGLRIARSSGYKAICFSGGRTRERRDAWPVEVMNSEAEGMISFARDMGMIGCPPPFILAESFARDYFENVFFSILCFRREFGQWPSRVGVVSWKFRAVRFYLIAAGLRLEDGCFTFYGSGDPHLARTREVVAAASARNDSVLIQLVDGEPKIVDPLHRHKDAFASKRFYRMPKDCVSNEEYMVRVKTAYDEDFDRPNKRQGEVSDLIDAVEELAPGSGWRDITWPWSV